MDAIPEIVRKAFRVATLEKPGPTHTELPENLAASAPESGDATRPLTPGRTYFPEPTDDAIEHAARLIAGSSRPPVLAGNGVLRRQASDALRALAKGLVPVAATFMGKGAGCRRHRRPTSSSRSSAGRARDENVYPAGVSVSDVAMESLYLRPDAFHGEWNYSQELETARRIGTNIAVVVWRDDSHGLTRCSPASCSPSNEEPYFVAVPASC